MENNFELIFEQQFGFIKVHYFFSLVNSVIASASVKLQKPLTVSVLKLIVQAQVNEEKFIIVVGIFTNLSIIHKAL